MGIWGREIVMRQFVGASSVLACGIAALISGAAAQNVAAPNFAPDNSTAWIASAQEFLAPASGPGPVRADPAHKPVPDHPQFRVADLSNPILQPWAREELRKANERALSGKAAYTPKERCWPIGVPGWLLYPVFPVYFLQTPKMVTLIWQEDHMVRHIYLTDKHSPNVKPSWFGESIGHYENGDTLVVDTIGLNTRTFVDQFRTPHSEKLHVVERYRLIDGGKAMEAIATVDDPGAFTTTWRGMQHYRQVDQGPLVENARAETNEGFYQRAAEPIPTAATPDF